MFSIERRGSDWVLRAGGADVMMVRSRAVAKSIVRQAVAAGKTRKPRAPAAGRRGAPARRCCDGDALGR